MSSSRLKTAAAAVAAPGAAAFLAAEVPRAYCEVRAWLTPPYLYFVINCIIISIAASARFQTSSPDPAPPPVEVVAPPPPVFFVEETETEQYVPEAVVYEAKEEVMIVPPETATPPPAMEPAEKPPAAVESVEKPAESAEEEFVISRSSWTPVRRESMEMPPLMAEKPMVSKRFGNVRRSPRPNPDGKALGVARPKKGETLESTWKAITDGRAVPLARHLKKSDTWAETRGDAGAAALMRKSDTLNDRGGGRQTLSPASSGGSGGIRLKREASLGQDDLNRRVEAFINKFNEEMRMQRQESCQQYLDMINSRKK